jgi:4'-phosphopantetheinyl transferase
MLETVDTYCAALDSPDIDVERFSSMLSAEERDRAGRFRFDHDRRRYVARRGILRDLIGSYLGCKPTDVAFDYNAYGKPALRDCDLHFNLSHSRGMALYAFSRGSAVGCDIEWRDPKFAAEQIPERFFSRDEVRALRSLLVSDQTEAFFNCWTRKEAYVKAAGQGLSIALDSFDVSLAPNQPAVFLRGCDGWSMQSFSPSPGFQAAVVVRSNLALEVDWAGLSPEGRRASARKLNVAENCLFTDSYPERTTAL